MAGISEAQLFQGYGVDACPHPDWRINWFAPGEPIPGAPLGGRRLTPICTVCGAAVQVGAASETERSRLTAADGVDDVDGAGSRDDARSPDLSPDGAVPR